MLAIENAMPRNLRTDIGDACGFYDRIDALDLRQQQRILGHHALARADGICCLSRMVRLDDILFGNPDALKCCEGTVQVDIGDYGRIQTGHLVRDMHHARTLLSAADQTHADRISFRLSPLQVIEKLHSCSP